MEEHKPQPIPEESLALGYEVRDVNLRNLVRLSVILAVVLVVIFGLVGLLLYSFLNASQVAGSVPPPPLLEEAQDLPPGPLLQRDPEQDMQEMSTEQDAILNNYGWVDKKAGVVRIPIERAIELTLERGLPTREREE
jgi:predicted Co/Zn/Cd cation transporter (cation efflux family)